MQIPWLQSAVFRKVDVLLACRTNIDPLSLYIHSDLRGFKPSQTTYVFFGR
jgi:hypothetical protein